MEGKIDTTASLHTRVTMTQHYSLALYLCKNNPQYGAFYIKCPLFQVGTLISALWWSR